MIEPIDNRLLQLTGALIDKGVSPTEAANIAKEMVLREKPWYSPDEAAAVVGLVPKVVRKSANAGAYRGARKFAGQWRIPASAILP